MENKRLFVFSFLMAMLVLGGRASDCRPETWFHLIGGNVSKEGLTADLEAIKAAGIGGIQFFHGQFGGPWPGTKEQIPCLSENWDDVVRHIGLECQRLGLTFKLQNCPGWSMSGGPWIDDAHAMRKLVLNGTGRDYRPLVEATVPDVPEALRDIRPVSVATNGDTRVFTFASSVTLRSLVLPSAQCYSHDFCYEPGLAVRFEVQEGGPWKGVFDRAYPVSNYSDGLSETFSFAAATGTVWRLTLRHAHPIAPRCPLAAPVFSAAERLDNWEAKAGWTLREVQDAGGPRSVAVADGTDAVARVSPRRLHFGHVNPEIRNHPAPPEATGYECDKLDPRGIEANFAGYVGRLLDGPLKGLPVKGLVIDSWECGAQSWTWKMPEYFKSINGYDLAKWLPALFGYVVETPQATEDFLRDWRRTQGELVKENYYRRFAELAHARGLEVQYETAMGDVIAGDILSYWKYADTPMCEFWSPHDDANGFVTSYDFKPVKPCVSAAHVYGKRRVAAESFTSFKLTWDETFADLKRDADKHFARGVTHLVFHTFTHNPRVGMPGPGSAFGRGIGTPFMRGQCWWPKMPLLTDYFARCGELLEKGLPVVDVLWYLGDDCAHKPSEKAPFPKGYKYDYITYDALASRATVKGGRLAFPDGMSYALLWVPEDVFLRPESERRIEALEKSGAKVVRGDLRALSDALKDTAPDLVYDPPANEKLDDFMWYHRQTADEDIYFLATSSEKGYRGKVRFRAADEPCDISLPPVGSVFAHVRQGRVTWEDPSHETQTFGRTLAIDLAACLMTTPYEAAPFRTYETNLAVTADVKTTGLSLDFGDVRGVLDVSVNGVKAGSLWCPPFVCDVTKLVRPGTNRLSVSWTGTWRKRLLLDAVLPEAERKTWTEPWPKEKTPEITWSVMHPTEIDTNYMARVVAKAIEYGGVDSFEVCGLEQKGINALSLFEPYPHVRAKADRGFVEKTRTDLNAVCALAHAVGKPVYLWHRENLVPPGLIEDVPELLDENGEFDLSGRAYRDYLRFKIADALRHCPALDGLVLTLTESEYSVLHNSKPERYPPRRIVREIAELFLDELGRRGKRLVLRSFGNAEDYGKIIGGAVDAAKATGVRFEVETKVTTADFVPWLPNNRFLRQNPPLALGAECDALGEFLGGGYLPAAQVGRIREYVGFCRSEGVDRYAIRIDRKGFSIFDTAHEVNLHAYMRFIRDPSATEDAVLREFADKRFGAAAPEMVSVLKGELELVRNVNYVSSNLTFHAFPVQSDFKYVKAGGIFSLYREDADLSMPGLIWSIFGDMKTPAHGQIRAEKDRGVRMAEEGLETIERLRPSLPADEYARQHRAFANAVRVARAMRVFSECVIAYFEEMSVRTDDPVRLRAAVAAAERVLAAERGTDVDAAYLDGVGFLCRELVREYGLERALRRRLESPEVCDFVVPGGIYDDVRLRRLMHACYPKTKADRVVRQVGNRRYPNGTLTVKLTAPADAEIVIELDPEGSQRYALSKSWKDGVWTVTVGKDGADYPEIVSIAAVRRRSAGAENWRRRSDQNTANLSVFECGTR